MGGNVDANVQLGLRGDWWIQCRDHQPVKGTLALAMMQHAWPRICDRLAENKSRREEPSTREALALRLKRVSQNLARWHKGGSVVSSLDILALASLLRIPVDQLLPSVDHWLATATCLLSNGTVPQGEAMMYAAYRLARPKFSNPTLDQTVVWSMIAQGKSKGRDSNSIKEAVLQTAKVVGELLQFHGWRLDAGGLLVCDK